MNRLPLGAFGALVAATVGAFFVVQHLKASTPLYAGFPKPNPAWINPRDGNACDGVDHRATTISFYLLHRADNVDVYVVNRDGAIVRTVASGRHMRIRVRKPDGVFNWDGRTDSGQFAPDGVYRFRVALRQQGRTVQLPVPVLVRTRPPRPAVTRVTPSLIPHDDEAAAIGVRGAGSGPTSVQVYRTDASLNPSLVANLTVAASARPSWDGRLAGQPAPAGTYLIGVTVHDRACNVGRFPPQLPPAPNSTRGAGVTVRYLAAQPPMDPTPAGTHALVYVDARQRDYAWTLTRVGASTPVARGSGSAFTLRVHVPARERAGLYVLALRSGAHRTSVPLVVSNPQRGEGSSAPQRVLVVLPALTWQGQNPVDDDGDGIPNTLRRGGPILLERPLANGLPQGFDDEAAILTYLDAHHLAYDLTTDLGLLDKVGPTLTRYRGVVLAGSERWQADSVGAALRTFAENGGRVLVAGVESLRQGVKVQGGRAFAPSAPAEGDIFAVRQGQLVTGSRDLIAVIRDRLGIFAGTSGAFPGFNSFQVLQPSRPPASAAGTSDQTTSVVGFRFGLGTVVEIGLVGFGTSLASDVDAQQLLGKIWRLLEG
ncbi:MAG: hypothetical protein JO153_14440 [Solirubrobacterales bacterium]|nr:hypothetical protein [Solirubrobacterales bacterium]